MRFLLILSALLLITGSGLATAGPDATGSPSAAPAPAATVPAATPVPSLPVESKPESKPAIPPVIIRLPAPVKPSANTLPPALPAGTAQAGQQADLANRPAQAHTLTTLEAPGSLQPSLETVLETVKALEKRIDAMETAIHQLGVRDMAIDPFHPRQTATLPQTDTAADSQGPEHDPKATSDPPPAADTVYVVQPGDTLNGLAARFAVEKRRLIEFNRLETPDLLSVGQRLRIPPEGSPRGVVMSPFREAQ